MRTINRKLALGLVAVAAGAVWGMSAASAHATEITAQTTAAYQATCNRGHNGWLGVYQPGESYTEPFSRNTWYCKPSGEWGLVDSFIPG